MHTLAEQIPFYRQRHAVRPGITGWAQINYKYGDTLEDTIAKLEYDLYYIKNMSLPSTPDHVPHLQSDAVFRSRPVGTTTDCAAPMYRRTMKEFVLPVESRVTQCRVTACRVGTHLYGLTANVVRSSRQVWAGVA